MAMELGINLPWQAYGADLGDALLLRDGTSATHFFKRYNYAAPTAKVGNLPVRNRLHHQLAVIKSLGITKVRWILIGDAWNFAPAPKINAGRWTWDVTKLQAPKGYVQDFDKILALFAEMKMQMVPCLANAGLMLPGRIQLKTKYRESIEYFPDPGAGDVNEAVALYLEPRYLEIDPSHTVDYDKFIKGGKQDILLSSETIKKFYDVVLDPLLTVSKTYRNVIPIWELFSEPDLIFDSYTEHHGDTPYWGPIDKTMLQQFLADGLHRIYAAGFLPTIGFQRPGNMDEYLRGKPIANAIALGGGAFERNFHFYPEQNDADTLSTITKGAVVSEFATKVEKWHKKENKLFWPEDLAMRLKILSDNGVATAYPWASYDDDTVSKEWSSFSAGNQDAMKTFVASNPAP